MLLKVNNFDIINLPEVFIGTSYLNILKTLNVFGSIIFPDSIEAVKINE